ncbi:MAG: hypothetical protein ABFS22_11650 [Pseudomonadota bacterium]
MEAIDPFECIDEPISRHTTYTDNYIIHMYYLTNNGRDAPLSECPGVSADTGKESLHLFIYRNRTYQLRLDGSMKGKALAGKARCHVPLEVLVQVRLVFQDLMPVTDGIITWAPYSLQFHFYSRIVQNKSILTHQVFDT